MKIAPSSTVKLYKNIAIYDDHMPFFKNEEKRDEYFQSHLVKTYVDCQYIRKTGQLQLEIDPVIADQCNYISFRNMEFENRKFFAKVFNWEYVNNSCVLVNFAIDYYLSYIFDAKFNNCTIEREQLTHDDYVKVKENPWRADIPEMRTEENIPVGIEYEKLYDHADLTVSKVTSDDVISMQLGELYNISMNSGNFIQYPYDIYAQSSSGEQTDYNKYYVIFKLSNINFKEWDKNDVTIFQDNLQYNNSSISFTVDDMFNSTMDNVNIPSAVVGCDLQDNKGSVQVILDLLTLYNCTSAINGMYQLPKAFLRGFFREGPFDTPTLNMNINNRGALTIPKLDVENPKLNRFPYRLLRVYDPSENIKEYHLEYFSSLVNGHNKVAFAFMTNVVGRPEAYFIPYRYIFKSGVIDDPADARWLLEYYNSHEKMIYNNFPDLPYTTDSYLAYLANQYSGAILSTTNRLSTMSSNVNQMAYNLIGEPLKAISDATFGSTTFDKKANNLTYHVDPDKLFNVYNLQNQLNLDQTKLALQNQYLAGSVNERFNHYDLVGDHRRAFATYDYHAGSSNGYFQYMNKNGSGLSFTVLLTELNKDVLQKYDDYFSLYGYSSHRYGIPHVIDHIQKDIPVHFANVKGEKIHYVKTVDCKVYNVPLQAANYIANLFNKGIQFFEV